VSKGRETKTKDTKWARTVVRLFRRHSFFQKKNFSKNFEKPLDKIPKVWYNNNTKERVAKATTEKNFQEISKKVLTNSEIYGIIYM